MKIVNTDICDFTVFLNSFYTKKIDFNDEAKLKSVFEKLFLKIKNSSDIDIEGFYWIDVFVDKYYGIVLEIKKEDFECFNYYGTTIDMQINKPTDKIFLYKIKDLFSINKILIHNSLIYKYKGNYYLKLIKRINFIDMGKLLEFATIIYDNCDKITQKENLVNMEV